jgi:sulfatase maturation enzyme AslB (radical SAM superfamily)
VINNLQELGVSIDGATKETYEKLRLGGRWDKINDNLQCMSELKVRYKFKFSLHMVVQADNWHEMDGMLAMGRRYNADRVYFNKIEDWNTDVDMSTQNFTDLPDFIDNAKRVKDDPISWLNFR